MSTDDPTADLDPPYDSDAVRRARAALDAPPERIGRYRILERLGTGGMGEVYVAEQTEPIRRRVAVKVIKAGMDSRSVVARFEAERQALAMMDHPNIAKVFDAGTTEAGRPYFVMELVRGVPITVFCDANKLTTRQRVELMVPVCQAVQHAHQKGIIHRDIKPHNVLVTLHDGKPVPKVIDFGIAKATGPALTDKTVYTEFRQLIGTPAYMSPEQAEMSGLDIDTRSDIYSLGALAYELLTGRPPFDTARLVKAGLNEIQRIIREEDPPRPSLRVSTLGDGLGTVAEHRSTEPYRLRRLVAGELDWIVARAMEKDRQRRYGTASDLAADLTRYLVGDPVLAGPEKTTYRLRKFVRKHRRAVTGVTAFTLVLVLGIAATTFAMIRARRQESRTVAALSQARRQMAISFEKAAALAEARGYWTEALANFRAAEDAGSEDRVAILIGQLRAIDRIGDDGEGATLINRVRRQFPAVYTDPQFTLLRGLVLWAKDPEQSRALIDAAIKAKAGLSTADGYFAEALTTDDVATVSGRLRASVKVAPFNREAWSILCLADLILGNLSDAEREARFIQLISPEDNATTVVAATAAALQGRPEDAARYVDDDSHLTQANRAAIRNLVELATENRSVDTFVYADDTSRLLALPKAAGVISRVADAVSPKADFRVPLAFSKLLRQAKSVPLYALVGDRSSLAKVAVSMPNGLGHYVRGMLELNEFPQDARREFEAASTLPSPIECRRQALLGIFLARAIEAIHKGENSVKVAEASRPALVALAKDGGFHISGNSDFKQMLSGICRNPGLCDVGRDLVLQNEGREPDNYDLLYYQSQAEWALGRREIAMSLLRLSLAHHESREARALLGDFSRAPTSRQATK